MESILQMLGPLILILLISILSNSRRRKAQQQQVEREREEPTISESDETPPPFMEDFPFETELEQMILQQDEEETNQVVDEPTLPETEEAEPTDEAPHPEPPPVPVESPTRTRSVPATSLLNWSPQTLRQGIILSEVLGKPKARSRRHSGTNRQ